MIRRWLRAVGEFFEVVAPQHPRLACGCLREHEIAIGCHACDFATCENHHTAHTCTGETIDAR